MGHLISDQEINSELADYSAHEISSEDITAAGAAMFAAYDLLVGSLSLVQTGPSLAYSQLSKGASMLETEVQSLTATDRFDAFAMVADICSQYQDLIDQQLIVLESSNCHENTEYQSIADLLWQAGELEEKYTSMARQISFNM
ncbi:hypothetical protein HOA92_04605 [archaeon]|jgi:hypothetical protein|nr:hypothetical protein [archaeon]MBT6762297.1 hypothetical protein [archaeon]